MPRRNRSAPEIWPIFSVDCRVPSAPGWDCRESGRPSVRAPNIWAKPATGTPKHTANAATTANRRIILDWLIIFRFFRTIVTSAKRFIRKSQPANGNAARRNELATPHQPILCRIIAPLHSFREELSASVRIRNHLSRSCESEALRSGLVCSRSADESETSSALTEPVAVRFVAGDGGLSSDGPRSSGPRISDIRPHARHRPAARNNWTSNGTPSFPLRLQ